MSERVKLAVFAALQAGWRASRAAGRALLGESRFERLVASTGLRELKARTWLEIREMPDGARLLLRPHDQCIVEEVYGGGVYSGAAIEPGQTVVDAGAHIGSFALMAAKRVGPTGRVLAFEPSPDTFALLRRNLELNPMPWVRLHALALGTRSGLATLHAAEPGRGNPAADTLMPAEGRMPVQVAVRPLDEVLAEDGVTRVDHLKVDVEGAELLVLDGAPKTLAAARRVVMEIHTPHVRREDAVGRLERAGLAARVVSESEHSLIVEAVRA